MPYKIVKVDVEGNETTVASNIKTLEKAMSEQRRLYNKAKDSDDSYFVEEHK